MKKYIDLTLTLFASLFINFGLLSIGSLWTDPGTSSEWYSNVSKAPWTPPGWVFGFAWTLITALYSILMVHLYKNRDIKYYRIFGLSWILNVLWNPLFFYLHWVWLSALVIIGLAVVVGVFIDRLRKEYGWGYAWYLLPYFIWLNIAASLNLFVALMN
jgi:translocator protein